MYRTQKARGVAAVNDIQYILPPWVQPEPFRAILPYSFPQSFEFPLFARPCPETPRHGFVESRECSSTEDLLKVFAETHAQDKNGEVLIMRRLNGRASAVATEGGVTWGVGNDGVTGGKGQQWIIPCPAGHFTKTIHGWDPRFRTDIKGAAYAELVEHDGEPRIVQLRDGPMVAKVSGNWVPHADYKVTEVVSPSVKDLDDLLAWETLCKKAQKGTAVWLINAGLTSHAAVQAITHGLAVVTKQVEVGEVLQPEHDQPKKLRRRDFLYMRNAGKKRVFIDRLSAAPLAISTLHAMPLWGREPHLLRLRILGAMTMLRLLAASCIGEDRHYYRCGPGNTVKAQRHRKDKKPGTSRLPWKLLVGNDDGQIVSSQRRSAVQDAVLGQNLKMLRELCRLCAEDFEERGWESGNGNDGFNAGKCGNPRCEICNNGEEDHDPDVRVRDKYGYGGPKWAASARIAESLAMALLAFRDKPNQNTWDDVVSCYNRGVLAAHNGGRALDKFTDWNHIDMCAKAPQFGFMGRMAMECVAETKKPVTKKEKNPAKKMSATQIQQGWKSIPKGKAKYLFPKATHEAMKADLEKIEMAMMTNSVPPNPSMGVGLSTDEAMMGVGLMKNEAMIVFDPLIYGDEAVFNEDKKLAEGTHYLDGEGKLTSKEVIPEKIPYQEAAERAFKKLEKRLPIISTTYSGDDGDFL